MISAPDGYPEIIAVFGNINAFIQSDGTISPEWERQNITRIVLPYSLRLAWNINVQVDRIAVHKLLTEQFLSVFEQFKANNWHTMPECYLYGGAYQFRAIRGKHNVSLHSFGIAIDMHPAEYPLGSDKRMPDQIVRVWTDRGFSYGGDWVHRKDPQHFQFATGY